MPSGTLIADRGVDGDLLGQSTPTRRREHAVADGERVDTVTDRAHGAGHLRARGERQRRLELVHVLDHQDIREVHRAGLDVDDDLAGFRLRILDLLEHQGLGGTERFAQDRSHGHGDRTRRPAQSLPGAPCVPFADAPGGKHATRTGPDPRFHRLLHRRVLVGLEHGDELDARRARRARASSASSSSSSASGGDAAGSATIKVATDAKFGQILVDSQGRTVYIFDKDMGTTSACTAGCATVWPAVVAAGTPEGGTGVTSSMLGTAQGQVAGQVTYNGHLLYRFAGDTKAGDVNGAAIPNWHPITPAGTAATLIPQVDRRAARARLGDRLQPAHDRTGCARGTRRPRRDHHPQPSRQAQRLQRRSAVPAVRRVGSRRRRPRHPRRDPHRRRRQLLGRRRPRSSGRRHDRPASPRRTSSRSASVPTSR